jgi:predicted short-subunit dehydrogenase-like oxidoreductase (DUF2520 family)
LLSIAESMLDTIGIVDPASVLAPLAIGTVVNAREGGGGGRTLTGPVVRGESDTVARHLAALGRSSPRSAELYREVASLIVSAAHRAGRIDDDTADAMTGLLRR